MLEYQYYHIEMYASCQCIQRWAIEDSHRKYCFCKGLGLARGYGTTGTCPFWRYNIREYKPGSYLGEGSFLTPFPVPENEY